jgi:hypothetical protein
MPLHSRTMLVIFNFQWIDKIVEGSGDIMENNGDEIWR